VPTRRIYVLYEPKKELRTLKLHKVIGFRKGDGECLLRGTDWIFKLNTLGFESIDFNGLKKSRA